MQIYTDGACSPNPGKGGWGFVIIDDGELGTFMYGGERNTTNNRMEMRAIIEALKQIPPEEKAVVYSDSDWCVKVINGRWKAKKNLDLVNEAKKLKRITGAEVCWVRGHNGNRWNEYADELAGRGRMLA